MKKTNYEWKKFETFCKEQSNGSFNVKNVAADALDKLPGKFFKDVRKQNGAEYEPDSLSSFQRSIQRRLKELKLSFNILKDEEFCRSREVSAAKRKNLVKQEFTKFKLVLCCSVQFPARAVSAFILRVGNHRINFKLRIYCSPARSSRQH